MYILSFEKYNIVAFNISFKEKVKDEENKDPISKMAKEEEEEEVESNSKLTLSGLLNFIDQIWSATGGERIIVFTNNYVEKLDPALIRRGRIDKHIELSYCSFEAFKVLAKNIWMFIHMSCLRQLTVDRKSVV